MRRSPEQTEQLLKEIEQMYEAGIPVADIAEEHNISAAYVYQLLARTGAKVGGGFGDRMLGRLTEREKAGIIQDYIDGEIPVFQILGKYGIRHTQLYNLLMIAGVPTRATAREPVHIKIKDAAIEMYKDGYPIKQIVAETGISQPTLHYEVHKRGIPLRNKQGGTRALIPNPQP